jgi:chromosome segregation ATPase
MVDNKQSLKQLFESMNYYYLFFNFDMSILIVDNWQNNAGAPEWLRDLLRKMFDELAIDKLTDTISGLEIKIDDVKEGVKNLEEKLNNVGDLDTQLRGLKDLPADMQKFDSSELEKDVKKLKDAVSELEDSIENVESKVETLEQKLNEIDDLDTKLDELNDLKTKLDDFDGYQLEQDVEEMKNDLENLTNRTTESEDLYNEIENNMKGLSDNISDLTKIQEKLAKLDFYADKKELQDKQRQIDGDIGRLKGTLAENFGRIFVEKKYGIILYSKYYSIYASDYF